MISSVAVRPQNEYERILERRAQERRQILDADKNVLPPYNIKGLHFKSKQFHLYHLVGKDEKK